MYEKDNDNRLPYAGIRYPGGKAPICWDTLIFQYVRPEGYDPRKDRAPKGILLCPSDPLDSTEENQRRRTYSMPWHRMDLKVENNWPPGSNNLTGVGLWWENHIKGEVMAELTNITAVVSNASASNGAPASSIIPCFRLSMIPAPADTLLLTEQVRSNNLAFNFNRAVIHGPTDYVDTRAIDPAQIHGGSFNHLMVDGHVELLKPEQTMGKNSGLPGVDASDPHTRNIWTVFPGD
jgi:prepilin-type processing-associated H-X9-DG protein